jgi:HNH endonuclease/AP2 domain
MPSGTPITQEFVRSILDYDPETGIFTWRRRPDVPPKWNGRYAGTVAGRPCKNHLEISIHKKRHQAHRLAFVWMTGECPPEVDHMDTDGLNNRWKNLRPATHSQNHGNKHAQSNNTSGYKGVMWCKRSKRWIAKIKCGDKVAWLGAFVDKESARDAYVDGAIKYFGEFARY